jgi:hypothetical protein
LEGYIFSAGLAVIGGVLNAELRLFSVLFDTMEPGFAWAGHKKE